MKAQLNQQATVPDDIKVNKINEMLAKSHVLQKNLDDKVWGNIGDRLKPILKEGVVDNLPAPFIQSLPTQQPSLNAASLIPSTTPPVTAAAPTSFLFPPSSQSAEERQREREEREEKLRRRKEEEEEREREEEQEEEGLRGAEAPSAIDPVVELLSDKIASNFLNKALTLYLLMKPIPGLNITPQSIKVDGKILLGPTAQHINSLIRPIRYLAYNANPLLEKIMYNDEITKLILNKQAKQIIKELKRKAHTRRSSFAGPFNKPGAGGKKIKRKFIWKSLF